MLNPPARLFRASMVLGAGLGGFLDGIVLHQILGWHHLVCVTETCRPNSVQELLRQTTQDGFFHLAMWCLTAGGIVLVLRVLQEKTERMGRITAGGALAGWGAFNFVEGLIDHQILGIHHVRPESPYWLAYDLAFLASGLALWFFGRRLARAAAAPLE
jgi:uncharacterized membrane protein